MAMGDRQLADHRTASCIELAPWACVRERLPTVLRTVLGRPASLAGAQAGLGTTVGTYQRSLCCRFAATGRPFRPRDRRAARQGTGCCDDHDLQLAHQRRPTGSHVGSPRRPFSNPSMSRTIRNGGHDATSAGGDPDRRSEPLQITRWDSPPCRCDDGQRSQTELAGRRRPARRAGHSGYDPESACGRIRQRDRNTLRASGFPRSCGWPSDTPNRAQLAAGDASRRWRPLNE